MANVVNTASASASTLEKCKALSLPRSLIQVPQIQVPQIPRELSPDPQKLVLMLYRTSIGVCLGFSIVAVAVVGTTISAEEDRSH